MLTHMLQMNPNDADMSWGLIPDDLWKNMLNNFFSSEANGIGFDTINDETGLTKILCFKNWTPPYIQNCEILSSMITKSGQMQEFVHPIAVFAYTIEVQESIKYARVGDWKVYDDNYPVDTLFFFQGNKLLASATPYESTIIFWDIDDSQQRLLEQSDERISANLRIVSHINVNVQWGR